MFPKRRLLVSLIPWPWWILCTRWTRKKQIHKEDSKIRTYFDHIQGIQVSCTTFQQDIWGWFLEAQTTNINICKIAEMATRMFTHQCTCLTNFTIEHALNCPRGGFPTLRHNEIRNLTGNLLTEVCHDVISVDISQLTLDRIRNIITSNLQQFGVTKLTAHKQVQAFK